MKVDDVKPQLTRVKIRSVNDPDVDPEHIANLRKTAPGRILTAQMFPNDFKVDPADLIAVKKPTKTVRGRGR